MKTPILLFAVLLLVCTSCAEEKTNGKQNSSEKSNGKETGADGLHSTVYAAGGEEIVQFGISHAIQKKWRGKEKAPYFVQHLRSYITAKKPISANYKNEAEFQRALFNWENDPLYGWCNKQEKNIDVNLDGLKIYTTIDLSMQQHAEWAVAEHLGKELQADMDNNNLKWKNPPFSNDLQQDDIDRLMDIAKGRSDRYLNMKHTTSASQKEIDKAFKTPTQMTLFSWNGSYDTIMSPMDSIRYHKGFLRASLVSMNPKNGHVKAFVGGPNFQHFPYDMAYRGRRQVGSTFKPFVYTTVFSEGTVDPCSEVQNIQYCYDIPTGANEVRNKQWCPGNAGMSYDGMPTSMRYALAGSMSNVIVTLLKQTSIENVVMLAERMGVPKNYLEPYPAITLGVFDLSVYEMVNAYCTFANKGIRPNPVIITKIETADGKTVYTSEPEFTEVMSENVAYLMVDMLKGTVNGVQDARRKNYRYSGTAMRLRSKAKPYGNIKYPVAGKTGTTQNNSDGWFIGMTPDLVTGVWVGGEDRAVRFRSIRHGQGANMALPIWGYYMNKLYSDSKINISTGDFEKPENMNEDWLNCEVNE
jgi:penicillin-binding protein 1A